MSEALDKEARLQARRLVIAEEHAKRVFNEFDVRYQHYVYGHPWFETEEERRQFDEAQGSGGEAEDIKRGRDVTSFPLHGMHMRVMLPYLLAGDPAFLNEQREGADPMEMAFVDAYNLVGTQVWEESDTTFEFRRALDDAYCYRIGWMKTEFDGGSDGLKLPVHRWVDARDMLFDCQTRSPRFADKRWVGEKVVMPIETAQWFAENAWDAKGYEFMGVQFSDAYADEEAKTRVRGAYERDGDPQQDTAGDFVRLVMVQVKGKNPWTSSAKLSRKKMNDPAGHDDVYDGEDHVLILEACGGYGIADSYKPIGRIEWPFPCKPGDFTYTPVALTRDNRSQYPYSIMQPGHSSQIAADLGIQAFNTDAAATMRRWFGVNEEAFQDPAEARRVIEGIEGGHALVGGLLKQGYTPQNAIGVGNFGMPSQTTKEAYGMNRENYEAVQGMNKFDVQTRANQTAYNTAVQNESAQVKIDSLNQFVRRAVVSLAEKGVMCARANMTYAEIKRWVNIPTEIQTNEGPEAVEKASLTASGREVFESELWPNNPDWNDIRREVTVNLEPSSIQFRNSEKQAADITELLQRQIEVSRIIGDTLKGGSVSGAQEIARRWNAGLKLLCKLKNIINYERILFDPEAFSVPEAPPLDPNVAMQAGVQAQGNALNAQQQAAATRLQAQGIAQEAIPTEVGGAG